MIMKHDTGSISQQFFLEHEFELDFILKIGHKEEAANIILRYFDKF